MHQSINLLHPELLPQRDWVRWDYVLIAAGGFLAVLVAMSGWSVYQVVGAESQLQRLKSELAVLTASNNDLKLHAGRTPDPDLQRVVAQLGKRTENEERLAQVLVSLNLGEGFTSYLEDLSRVQVPGLWLNQIELDEGGQEIALRGFSRTADRVPQFLQDLSGGAEFRGRVFDHLKIEAQEDGSLAFEIKGPEIGDEQ